MSVVPWSAEQKNTFLAAQFNAREAHYSKAFANSEASIILWGGAAIGRLLLQEAGLEIRIVDFALSPEFQGRGIGSETIRKLQAHAKSLGRGLSGSVDRFSRAAAFWTALGFRLHDNGGMYIAMEWP